jgi:hypothetical protein
MRASRLATAGCALLLFGLNFYVCRDYIFLEYSQHLGSIEAAYISISRYILDNWRDLTWFPLWYAGVPFQNTYPPLLHVVVAAVAAWLDISPALSHHAVSGTFYCLLPVTLFWMAYRISGACSPSFAAGLLISILSPAGFLIYGVRKDMDGLLHARRLQTLVEYGEGPHLASLMLLPLAVLALHAALRRGRLASVYLAAAAAASVVLANFIGGAALLLAALSYLLADIVPADFRTWLRASGIGALAYVLAGPWIPPTTLLAIRTNAQKIGGEFTIGPPHVAYFALLALAAWAARRLLLHLPLPPFLRFALLFAFFTGAVTLAAEWRGIFLIPQPHRYHLEMELALALVLAFGAAEAARRLPRRAGIALLAVCLLGAAWQTRTYRRYARTLVRPIHMSSTVEYRMARWLEEHMRDRRVMVQGTISFWLNTFADTPQLGGGFEQGIVSDMNRHVIYGLYANERADNGGEIGVLWLKALGVHAIAMGGPGSREFFKPIRDPDKFRGLLPELWREGDDAIYGVPHRTDSLARVVPRPALPYKKPEHALDADPIRPYVAALDDPDLPAAAFRWKGRHRARIEADLPPDHVLSVQLTYHPGWRALVNGRPTALRRDNISQMVVDPGFDGPVSVELIYDGGIEARLLRWLRWCAVLYLLLSLGAAVYNGTLWAR